MILESCRMSLCCRNSLPTLNKLNIFETSSFVIGNRTLFKFYSTGSSELSSIEMSYNKYDSVKAISSRAKPPVVIMHGLFGSKTNWQSLSKALNKTSERTVIAVDARNHGNSPHTDEFSYELLADDIKHLLDRLSLREVCLIGHSMGGRAAMTFSLRYPQYLEKLIIVDISPFNTSRDMTLMMSYFEIMRTVQLDDSISTVEGRKRAAQHMSQHIKNPTIVDFLLTNLVKTKSGMFKWRMNLDSLERNFANNIMYFSGYSGQFDKPTYFIAGLKSDYLSQSDENKIIDIFPQSKFIYLNTGHWVHAEDPAKFISTVTDFLNS